MRTLLFSIVPRTALLAGIVALAAGAMLVRGESAGITFAVENVNLTVDSTASYNGVSVETSTWELKDLVPGVDRFFNFGDIKPGDNGENTISIHVDKNAWVCLAFDNLQESENGINEPESQVDASAGGELAGGVEFFSWLEADGDNVFEPSALEEPLFGVASAASLFNNAVYAIADALNQPPIAAGETRYFGVAWCAGNLSVNLATGAMQCDGTVLGNEAQTDSFTVDVSLGAVNATDNPSFTCSGDEPPPEEETGLGEEIGLFVKCGIIANFGWPLPDYSTECPNGFGNSTTTAAPTASAPPRSDRGTRTR